MVSKRRQLWNKAACFYMRLYKSNIVNNAPHLPTDRWQEVKQSARCLGRIKHHTAIVSRISFETDDRGAHPILTCTAFIPQPTVSELQSIKGTNSVSFSTWSLFFSAGFAITHSGRNDTHAMNACCNSWHVPVGIMSRVLWRYSKCTGPPYACINNMLAIQLSDSLEQSDFMVTAASRAEHLHQEMNCD